VIHIDAHRRGDQDKSMGLSLWRELFPQSLNLRGPWRIQQLCLRRGTPPNWGLLRNVSPQRNYFQRQLLLPLKDKSMGLSLWRELFPQSLNLRGPWRIQQSANVSWPTQCSACVEGHLLIEACWETCLLSAIISSDSCFCLWPVIVEGIIPSEPQFKRAVKDSTVSQRFLTDSASLNVESPKGA
jgi:hypothetical protein